MKRIIAHLKENWIKYGFETLVVTVGILGAYSLNNWNENQKERKKELILLHQLRDDFETNQNLIELGLEQQKDHEHIIRLILNHTGPDVSLPDPEVQDTLELLDYTIVDLLYTTINPSFTADQHIESNKLKTLLTSFPGIVAKYKDFENISRELTIEARMSHKRHVAILSMDPGMQTKEQTPHSSDYLAWLRDRDYQNLVIDRLYQIQNANNALLDLKIANENILKLISQELLRIH